jgi:hypothetical protein
MLGRRQLDLVGIRISLPLRLLLSRLHQWSIYERKSKDNSTKKAVKNRIIQNRLHLIKNVKSREKRIRDGMNGGMTQEGMNGGTIARKIRGEMIGEMIAGTIEKMIVETTDAMTDKTTGATTEETSETTTEETTEKTPEQTPVFSTTKNQLTPTTDETIARSE